MPKIRLYKSAHGTVDAIIYDMPSINIVNWFSLIDIWGSRGYDCFNDGGLYFEIPMELYDIIPDLHFVKQYNIVIEK